MMVVLTLAILWWKPGLSVEAGFLADRGARETPAPTGLFFNRQTPEALADAIRRYESHVDRGHFDPAALRTHATKFAKPRFLRELRAVIDGALSGPRATLDALPPTTL